MRETMSAEHSADPKLLVPVFCLPHLLEHQAKRLPEATAILAPGRAPLSYGRLYRHVEQIGRTLRTMGIGRHDRVAVVLPNGPEMAVAILAVTASASCAPMNPAYQAEELNKYFADLRPRALITQAGFDSPASRVALSRGVRIIELSTALDAAAGLFRLTGEQVGAPLHESANPDDAAVVLLTSGTTSRPKVVPQTHANICTSAYSSVTAFALRETDRCINILPLFHGHALINIVIASLAAGASVVCTPGYDSNEFIAWLTAFKPTWYSAVPTIHQAILTQARHDRERVACCRLRFIRSSSAPLPPNILTELESTFEAPVIECYAMTETTSTLITCNPLPPGQRKARSVGKPASLDVAIMDEGGTFLAHGQTGQIVVRGAGVMPGYDGDPIATQAAFTGGWFKTGDLGFFDDDGYLFLTGRSREIINRGGEKIAPLEVDSVLLEHPAVAEAVSFAVPHPTLGEDIGSAVVLRGDGAATAEEIRQFVIGRVAEFKVPRQVVIVRQLPRGPTGKVRRVDLAMDLELATRFGRRQVFVAPRTPLERLLAEHWAKILQVERVGIHDDFFTLGGDSLLVTHIVARIYDSLHLEIDVSRFFEAPTIAETAHHLETLMLTGQTGRPSTIARVPRANAAPASIGQERVYKLQRVLRGMPFFNVFCPLRLTSKFDVAILERSINEIVQRHEILRTTFAEVDGQCVQVIAPQVSVDLRIADLHALPRSKKESAGHLLIQEQALHSFDLTEGPLFRIRLVRSGKREHLLLITMHGIIVDGWSLGIIVEEIFTVYNAFYAGSASPLAPLSIQFADFAHWQRRWRSHPDIVAQLTYWREQLRDPLPVMRVATRPATQTIDNLRTARREVTLPASLSEAAKLFSVREGGTLYMTLVAALKTVLQRYLGQDDLRVATLIANRNRPGIDGLVGPLANTVILRTNLGGNPSLREVLRRVRTTALAAFAHQDLPYEELVEALERERPHRPITLAQVMIALHNATLRPKMNSRHGLTFQEANPNLLGPLVAPTTFDVCLMLRETSHGIRGFCVYKPHLMDAITIDRLIRDFQEVLQRMATQPDQPISEIRVSLNGKPS
jgi:acyl-CoA synthetase (AMP-forming)/AMP-acid ligase II